MDWTIGTYYEDDVIKVSIQYLEGYHIVHLDINKWTPSIVKKLRVGLDQLLEQERQLGVEMLFATGVGKNKPKLFNMIKPCYMLDPVPDLEDCWVGSWETGA